MFESLSNRLSKIIHNINTRGVLTEDSLQKVLSEVRIALLEADVTLPVVRTFMDNVKAQAIGSVIRKGLTPSQEFVRIVHGALVQSMGGQDLSLNLSKNIPSILLVVGFQGAGKTTTCAKIAKYLSVKEKKKVLLSSVDIYRPSGIRQLEILSNIAGIDFLKVEDDKNVINMASYVLRKAKSGCYDVVLIDTVGCLLTDLDLISEIVDLSSFLDPAEILLVVDAMLGQESAKIASFFSSKLSLSGVVLTKIDGDSRGGAALSTYHTINKSIKFIGTGEKVSDLEPFYVNRMASRILGMGDVLSLIEDIEHKVESVHVRHTLSKLNKGGVFDLSDFLNHLKQMRDLGGVDQILSKLPIMGSVSDTVKSKIDDKILMNMEVIISSMTIEERKYPNIIDGSRKRRIASGSGVSVQSVNVLLKRFGEVKSVMSKISKNGLSKVLDVVKNKLSSGFFQNKV
ncbi:signal recognition particle protein [Blochmannia endosymbiont of Polyrhachis (Hedomyrma) turneri]|uniref:signal recognition particle protein n=1 Tax=Blochmannia endosymbiont of Polyrhachis (Hedomyrma) turneri TaxID=1505596 RepID=UPI00061A548A|nr:signal recognition particle protein [Blochmannia endosymbiont of Polyrhachis (Hedomyrma) turneri]AKC59754.1 signal recognition particle protein [Blochmannia endosymbiont of Polyrhachis (Hedomyrma) turneri]